MRCSREIRDLAGSPIRERSRRCALPIETGQYKIEPPRQWCHLVNAGTGTTSRMRGDKQRQHPPGILGSAYVAGNMTSLTGNLGFYVSKLNASGVAVF